MTDQELKELFEAEMGAASSETRVPAAGQIWWRSAIRARGEAAHAAARPMIWLQAVVAAGAVGMVAGGATLMWPQVQQTARQLLPAMVSGATLPLVLAVGVAILAAPIVFFFAVPRD